MTLQNFTLGTFAQGAAGGGGAFESIATANGTGSSATITFSSIPSTYQHLQIRGIWRSTGSGTSGSQELQIYFNSDTGTNYVRHYLQGNGTSASAGADTAISGGFYIGNGTGGGTTSNIVGANIIDILDYASTTKNKTVRGFSGADINSGTTTSVVRLGSGLWTSTAAISTIVIKDIYANFSTQTTFALYGIKG